MKKITVLMLIALMCFSLAWAEDTSSSAKEDCGAQLKNDYASSPAYAYIGERFVPTNARMAAMGGAGLALVDAGNGLFVNPASLSEGKLRISLPSASVTLYHAYAAFKKDDKGMNLIDHLSEDENLEAVDAVVKVVGSSLSPFLSVDADASVVLPFGLGFGLYGRNTIYTYNGKAIDELTASLALGYAYGFNLGSLRLSAGAAAKLNVIAFNQSLGMDAIADADKTEEVEMNIAAGYSLPVLDFGLTAEWKGLSASVVVSNMLASYKMAVVHSRIKEMADISEDDIAFDVFEIESKPTVDVGLGYELDTSVIDAAVAVDFKDVVAFHNSLEECEEKGRLILKHLNCGLELSLADTLALRGGLSSGYFTLGAAIDLFALRIEAAYYWNEFGTVAGERAVDGLTIRFNLGYER